MDLNAALAEIRNAIALGLICSLDMGGFPPAGFNRHDARATVISVIGGAITEDTPDRAVDGLE